MANATPLIDVLAVGAALTLTVPGSASGTASIGGAVGGALAFNKVNTVVEAILADAATTATTGGVTVRATQPQPAGDVKNIHALAIGVAAGINFGGGSTTVTIAIGIAIALNEIGTSTHGNVARAQISGGSVNAAGDVSVIASATATSDVLAVAVGLSVNVSTGSGGGINATGSAGAAAATNDLNTVVEALVDDADVTSGGAVTVSATQPQPAGTTNNITAKVIAVAVSVSISSGSGTSSRSPSASPSRSTTSPTSRGRASTAGRSRRAATSRPRRRLLGHRQHRDRCGGVARHLRQRGMSLAARHRRRSPRTRSPTPSKRS